MLVERKRRQQSKTGNKIKQKTVYVSHQTLVKIYKFLKCNTILCFTSV